MVSQIKIIEKSTANDALIESISIQTMATDPWKTYTVKNIRLQTWFRLKLYYVLNVPYLECYFGGITSLFDRPMRLWIKRLVPFCSSSKMVIACHVISGFTSHGMVAQTLIASYPPLFLRKKTSKFTPCGLIQRISGFVQRLGIQQVYRNYSPKIVISTRK